MFQVQLDFLQHFGLFEKYIASSKLINVKPFFFHLVGNLIFITYILYIHYYYYSILYHNTIFELSKISFV